MANMFSEQVQGRAAARDATRRRVLASAERLFRERGFAATTVREIAADAGVSTGSVMAVGDKDGLLVSVFDDWIAAVHQARGEPEAFGGSPKEAAVAILGVFAPFLAYFARDPQLSREYTSIIVRGTHTSEIFGDLAVALVAELGAVLSGIGMTPTESARGARVMYFAYLGIIMTAGNFAAISRSPLEQIRETISFVLSAHHTRGL
ncbi:transcriptional regulator, TetR family [Rhodococcus erythropolis SK121]|nr:transcriptional regulator, TetR family [Rhodococcus erythropolis SK121]